MKPTGVESTTRDMGFWVLPTMHTIIVFSWMVLTGRVRRVNSVAIVVGDSSGVSGWDGIFITNAG